MQRTDACPPRTPTLPLCPAAVPDEAALRRALFLTAGNARELRDTAPALLGEADMLGLSVGYKVAASERSAVDASGM